MTHVEWHQYPKETPTKEMDEVEFLLTFKASDGFLYTSSGEWYEKNKEWDTLYSDEVIAWAEMPEPYCPKEPEDNHPDAVTARKYMSGDPETVKALSIFDE